MSSPLCASSRHSLRSPTFAYGRRLLSLGRASVIAPLGLPLQPHAIRLARSSLIAAAPLAVLSIPARELICAHSANFRDSKYGYRKIVSRRFDVIPPPCLRTRRAADLPFVTRPLNMPPVGALYTFAVTRGITSLRSVSAAV
ncbi:hypothetical protein K438DRAFT_1994872 [Mycena galopus ATCC 62051]|nr:hypothetical protein K438DRAFT_1994872 [Mycena galopus ATCC 62051]